MMNTDDGVYIGPSVYDAAEITIRRCGRQIADLQHEMAQAKGRLANPKYRHVLEAERVANEAERFMPTVLPE